MISEHSSAYGVDYLFVRIPRTGSTSMCNSIGRTIEHRTAEEWVERLGKEEYERRFTFSVVRNPYDRFVSLYYFFGLFLKEGYKDPNDFLAHVDMESIKTPQNTIMLRSQSDYLLVDGEIGVDYVGRFETLQESWDEIRARSGGTTAFPHLPMPPTLPWMRRCRYEKVPLTEASKEKIYAFYKKDFDVFGYDK